jgi:hypothetical protein
MKAHFKRMLRPVVQNVRFVQRGFQDPAPNWVKWRVLKKHFIKGGTCVETGTYLGETTEFLSRNYPKVISLEPHFILFENAKVRFESTPNVEVLNISSEDGFDKIVNNIFCSANFWLDGHFSGDGTFDGGGITPIEIELEVIKRYMKNMADISIAIDDFRLFQEDGSSGYPSPNILVNFANRNGFNWTIERDIFLMRHSKMSS